MKDEEKKEIKRAFDELEKKFGKYALHNGCLYRAMQIKSELIPRATSRWQSISAP